jgi:hypothetical protein
MRLLVGLCAVGLGCGSTAAMDAGSGSLGAGHFTYGVGDKVFRIEARIGASPQDVSAGLARFGAGTRDRWLVPSLNGAHLVLSTDRLTCSMGECLVIAPADLSSLSLVTPGGAELSIEGTPAVNNAADTIVYSSQDGPHEIDLWVTRKSGATWGAASLLTGSSTAAYNNMAALTFDERRVFFDCGTQSLVATMRVRCGSTAVASERSPARPRCPTRVRTSFSFPTTRSTACSFKAPGPSEPTLLRRCGWCPRTARRPPSAAS